MSAFRPSASLSSIDALDSAPPHSRSNLRLPTELLLQILALATSPPPLAPVDLDLGPLRPPPHPAQTASLVGLAPTCPLFGQYARACLLEHPVVATEAQAASLLRFLTADRGRGAAVRGLTVRAAGRGRAEGVGMVRAAQVAELLEVCVGLEVVRVEEVVDEREEYAEGGSFPLRPLIDQLFSLLIFPNFFPRSASSPPVAPDIRPKIHLPALRHLALANHLPAELSPLIHPSHLPNLCSLTLPRFTYSFALSQLTPQLVAIRGAFFSPDLSFRSARACCYTGSLNATSYNLPPSLGALFVPVMPRVTSVPWIVSALSRLDKLQEVHMLALGGSGESVRGACKERGVRLVEIDLGKVDDWGGDGSRYWERMVARYM